MVKITKVYTKQGDTGLSALAKGEPISKDALRMQLIGKLDELNVYSGYARSVLVYLHVASSISQYLLVIQHKLFNLGAQLAALSQHKKIDTPSILREDVEALENNIDEMNASLPQLNSFIIPGGHDAVCRLHLARTICRSAERKLVALSKVAEIDDILKSYLNRLSDWMFVASRMVASQLGDQEQLWDSQYSGYTDTKTVPNGHTYQDLNQP